jgi:hypothetical protein
VFYTLHRERRTSFELVLFIRLSRFSAEILLPYVGILRTNVLPELTSEIWYGRYAIGGCSKLVLFNFLQSVIPTWRMLKIVRWEDKPPPWRHQEHWSSATTDDVIARDAVYSWSSELFVLHSVIMVFIKIGGWGLHQSHVLWLGSSEGEGGSKEARKQNIQWC